MDVTSIALSGLNGAEKRLAKAAHNISNATTPGFKPDEVSQTAQESGGVIVDISQSQTDEPVSLEKEIVDSVQAKNEYEANLAIIKRNREMDKSLLDIQA